MSALERTRFFNISMVQCVSDGARVRVRVGADVVMRSITASWVRV